MQEVHVGLSCDAHHLSSFYTAVSISVFLFTVFSVSVFLFCSTLTGTLPSPPSSLLPLSCGLGSNKELIAGSDAHTQLASPGLPDCPTQGKDCQVEEVKGIEVR